MKHPRIIESWDKIEPSRSAHDRMLSAVLEQNRLEHERKEKVKHMDKSKKSAWVKWGAVAACLCLIVGGVIFANNRPQVQQGDAGIGIDGTVPGGTLPEGVDPVMASIAVFPTTEKLEDVENAVCVDFTKESLSALHEPNTESESVPNALSRYLPSELPKGYSLEHTSLYETTMKNGAKYYMLRTLYSDKDTSEYPDTANQFNVSIMSYRPDTQKDIYTVDELTQERCNGTFHLSMDHVYIGVSDDAGLSWDDLMTIVHSLKPMDTGDYTDDVPVDENTYSEAQTYSTELLDLQNRISAAMANHELPFVTTSAILGNPDRLHVTVNTTDENAISLLKSYDATGKLLEIEYVTGIAVTE